MKTRHAKLDRQLNVRFTEEQWDKIQQAVDDSGAKTPSEWIRAVVIKQLRLPVHEVILPEPKRTGRTQKKESVYGRSY